MKAAITNILRVRVENIPSELKARAQWVNWRLEEQAGKVPYSPRSGRRASSTDLTTWATFEEAQERLSNYDGLGFVFSSGDPYAGVDLDSCVDTETGQVAGWALEIARDLAGYIELSPSGTGLHIIVQAKLQNRRRGRIEAYSQERYFTITGHVLEVAR